MSSRDATHKGLFYLVVSLLGMTPLYSVRAENPVTFVEVQQQTGLDIGYRLQATDRNALSKSDPQIPHGYGDANLEASGSSEWGASGKAILVSRFRPNKLTAKGSAGVDSAWKGAPPGADNANVQAASLFLSRFRTGDRPVTLTLEGLSGVGLREDRAFHPERTALHIKLSTGSGKLFWEERLGETNTPALKAVGYGQTLVPREEYCLVAYAEAGALSDPKHDAIKSRAAWFDLSISMTPIPAAEADAATAVLVVITPELQILKVDGKPISPSCVSKHDGFREYTLSEGEHVIVASFCSLRPASKWTANQVEGSPLTYRGYFVAGYDYVALYRMQPYHSPESPDSTKGTPTQRLSPRDARWSLEVANLVDARWWLSVRTPANPTSASLPQRGQSAVGSANAEKTAVRSVYDQFCVAPEVTEAIAWRSFGGTKEAYVKQTEPNSVVPPSTVEPANPSK